MVNLKTCPTCGGKHIHKVCRTVTRSARGGSYTVPRLVFYECPDCGEQVYSPEAMEKIEAHRPKLTKAVA